MAYELGAVQPFVRDVANTAGPALDITNIGGWRATSADMSGHPAGLALDFQVGQDKTKGDRVAAYFVQQASPLQVKYVIWQQRIWYPGSGWKNMEHRPGDAPGYDPNHMRHVHVSFNSAVSDGRRLPRPTYQKAASGGGIELPWWIPISPALATGAWVYDALGNTGDVISTVGGSIIDAAGNVIDAPLALFGLVSSRSTWIRVGQVLGGVALVGVGVAILFLTNDATKGVATKALMVAPSPVAKAAGAAAEAAS